MYSKDLLKYEPLPLPNRMSFTDAQMQKRAKKFLGKMRKRHSVREFSERWVPRQVIEDCLRTAITAPSGANHQPWHFVAVCDQKIKALIRREAELEERKFYEGGGGDEWIKALEPIGTTAEKPHLTLAPWLIVIFAQRWGEFEDGTRYKNYYVSESVNIATGFLLAALHHSGLCTLTHTPNPMKFLGSTLNRPANEKPTMIITVGHPATDATVPAVAKWKKPFTEVATFFE